MATCPRCQDPDEGEETLLCADCAPVSPGATLQRALETWRDHLPTFLLFWAVPAAASTVRGAGVFVRNRAAFEALMSGAREALLGGQPAGLGAHAAALAPWLAVDAVVSLAFFGATYAVAEDLARGGDPGPLPGIRTAATRLAPLLATGVAFHLAFSVGFLLLVVPGLVVLHWFLLALPAAGAGAGPGDAFRRSRALVREHGTPLFPTVVVAVWFGVGGVAGAVVDLAVAVAGFGALSLPGVLVSGIAEWFVGPILPLFVATYYVHLEAADERAAAGPDTDEDDDVVVGQCPDCGAFVPDDRTRPELDPVCPTCGYQGPLD